MIPIGGIVEGAGFVNDAITGFLRLDDDSIDMVNSINDLGMQDNRGFDRGLGMKFGWKRY